MGWAKTTKAPISMVAVQVFTTGMMLLSRVALSEGMFVFSLLAYRHAIGSLFVAPFALFLERDMEVKLTFKALLWVFLNALFGITMSLGFYYYGLRDTSASYSSNLLNLIPVVTFIIALTVGMERVDLESKSGKTKVLGALFCVGGALVFGLYEGEVLHIWPAHSHAAPRRAGMENSTKHRLRGTVLLICSCFSFAFWFITQAKLFKVYPSKYRATMLTCLAGTFQTIIIGVSVNQGKDAWGLKWDLQLLTILYSGILNTAATFCLISWVVSQRGPTYPSMFNSLAVVFTTILESFFMGQDITVGSLLGMAMIFGGLYGFLWGKNKEYAMQRRAAGGERSAPLEVMQSQSAAVVPVLDKELKLHSCF
ncbi:hypothetical protein HPP92_008984 [Vanilla planifolia]|uniref:WAT1-related protein n=1 Tax=Vanilla planifolia TaxID=51239 RepID=A0A835RBH7_VANPL|nr:hypothetical protein HPP92_008984 [Vanilla planifolia]